MVRDVGPLGELHLMKYVSLVAVSAIVVLGVSCTGTPLSPTSPSAASGGTLSANSDGSTLKMTAPAVVSPFDSEQLDSRRPTFVWLNATGVNESVGVAYEIEVRDESDNLVYHAIVGETPNNGSHTPPADLEYSRPYGWRIRAALGDDRGPWSVWGNFRTVTAPASSAPTSPNDGTVGPPRSIAFQEAYAILKRIHDQGRVNLGSRSSRNFRVNFLFGAVAAIHYGHSRWNPQGPDSDWCVKDAGGGRPPSDDVLVRCSTREAWDLIVSAGADGYSWHQDFLGILPRVQNVYPPGRGSLNFLP